MAKKKIKLDASEQRFIDSNEALFKQAIEDVEKLKQFKEGDFLIMYFKNYKGQWDLQKNSYGSPAKYTVVSVSESGLPFMKQINAKGNPVGPIISGFSNLDDGFLGNGSETRWELDPDYADALLLQDEYDPSQLHNSKKTIWKEVTEHNKKCKIPTTDIGTIIDFLKTVQVGDTLWTSNVSHFMVRDVKTLNKADAAKLINRHWTSKVKGPYVLVITIVDKKGVVREVAADYFWRKALYKERPRTYKELNL